MPTPPTETPAVIQKMKVVKPQESCTMTPHRIAKILQAYNDDERDTFIKVMQEEDDKMGFSSCLGTMALIQACNSPDSVYVAKKKSIHASLLLHTGFVMIPGICASRPDRPGRATQTKMWGTARTAVRQKRYDESTFSARLAKVLRRHGTAVHTARTSSSVMRGITDQLARLASKDSRSSSNEDVPARHGPCGPERPPTTLNWNVRHDVKLQLSCGTTLKGQRPLSR
jgi:hypothetical protein